MNKCIQGAVILGTGLLISTLSAADIAPYSDNFESYLVTDEFALGNAGWLVFGNVYSNTGTFLYMYGPEPAPNGGSAFSGIATTEGGPAQGAQQLNVYNDYANTDHANNPTRLIESIVYREVTVGAANVGQTWNFFFEAKLGNLLPNSTAQAFIKTIDPLNGFATTNLVEVSMTNTPLTWTGYTLSLTIDEGLVDQLFQIGFSNTASGFTPSAVFYDNINLSVEAGVDSDGDGVTDDIDNCTDVANATQVDSDGDGHGNICDADFDQNCFTTFPDLALMQGAFFSNAATFDLDSNGFVTFPDLAIMQGLFFSAPGPSAPGASCNGT